MTDEKRLPTPLKLALELGPLAVLFLGNNYAGKFGFPEDQRLLVATALFIPATLLALAVNYALVRKLPIMPRVSAVVVVVMGGLTLLLNDDLFIKLKPTIVNTLYGLVLLGGLYFNKSLLKIVFDGAVELTDEGWRKLTLRWGFFFLGLAVLNEVIWRTQSADFWVNFKVFGMMPITIAFFLSQMPLMARYDASKKEGQAEEA